METPQHTTSPSSDRNLENDVADLMQMMGQSLNKALLYGLDHKVTRQSIELSYTVVAKFIEYHDAINLSITEGSLLINGVSTSEVPQAANFAARLTTLNLISLVIAPGFPPDEYLKFFSLLTTAPSKLGAGADGAALVEQHGFRHLQARAFTYRRVAHDEDAPTPVVAPPPESSPAEPEPNIGNIAAFLQNEPAADPARAAEDIRQLANDPGKLADLVVKSAESGAQSGHSNQSLSDLLVECIRKVLDQIVADPVLKTQKGRKQVKRSLIGLEKILQDRLPSLVGDKVTQTVETMIDDTVGDLDLEALAGKYLKSRLAVNQAGDKLSRLIDRASGDPSQLEEVREHLTREGLTPAEWHELTQRNNAATAEAKIGLGGGTEEIKALALLLASLNDTLQKSSATPESESPAIRSLITETGHTLSSLARTTQKKIRSLQDQLHADDATTPLSRKELLERLAEIAQEISQPLTIISGTIAMIRTLRTGPLTEIQGELLGMVAESTDRMIQLVDSLMRLAGPPLTLEPDRAILDAAYGKR